MREPAQILFALLAQLLNPLDDRIDGVRALGNLLFEQPRPVLLALMQCENFLTRLGGLVRKRTERTLDLAAERQVRGFRAPELVDPGQRSTKHRQHRGQHALGETEKD